MLLLLAIFIAFVVFVGWIGRLPKYLSKNTSIPANSTALSAGVAQLLNGSAIPDYVLTYGTTALPCSRDPTYDS